MCESLVDGSVSEEHDSDLPATAELCAESRSASDREARTDDAVAAEHPELDVGDVHRAAQAAAIAARPAHELGHHAPNIRALRDEVTVAAVISHDVVIGAECRRGSDGDRLLSDTAVCGTGNDSGREELGRPLLEPPDQVQLPVRRLQLAPVDRRRYAALALQASYRSVPPRQFCGPRVASRIIGSLDLGHLHMDDA